MRGAALLLAAALLALIWATPLGESAGPLPGPFATHMLRHMVLVALAAPLLVLGWPRLGDRLALSPLVAAAIEFVVVWAWHLPQAHGLAWQSGAGFVVEQGSFLLAGLLVWAGCLRAEQPLAGAGGLLLTSMHMTLLGALLILAPRDLYAEFRGLPPDLAGQQAGGLLMLGIGTPVYLVAGLALTARALRDPEAA